MSATRSAIPSISLLGLAALVLAVSVDAAGSTSRCAGAKTNPLVGFKGKFTTRDHNVAGEVEVVDDCTFRVTGFRYDGRGPSVFWWGVKTLNPNDLRSGFKLNNEQIRGASNNAMVTVELGASLTWDQVGVLSVWCDEFDANFGEVILFRPPAVSAPAKAPAAAAGAVGTATVRAAAAPAPGPGTGPMVERGSAALAMAAAAPSCTNGNKACAPSSGLTGTAP